jgi:hypothetical protein
MSRPNLPGVYTDYYPKEYQDYNTQYKGQIESVGWKWWDTQTYVSGTTTLLQQWFNVRATQDLSNMEVAFQLSAPKAFLCRAIRFFIKQRPSIVTTSAIVSGGSSQVGALDNVAQLINTGVFTLTVGNKQYVVDPLWVLTAGAGAMGFLGLTGAASMVDFGQNGIADPRAVNTLSKPLFIAPQINFTASVSWPAALTLAGGNQSLCFLLDGDLLRPVQ